MLHLISELRFVAVVSSYWSLNRPQIRHGLKDPIPYEDDVSITPLRRLCCRSCNLAWAIRSVYFNRLCAHTECISYKTCLLHFDFAQKNIRLITRSFQTATRSEDIRFKRPSEYESNSDVDCLENQL